MTEPWTALAGAGALMLAATGSIALNKPIGRSLNMFALLEVSAFIALVTALGALSWVLAFGATATPLVGYAGIGLSLRLDIVSAIMLTLVSFMGFVVVRYSRNYLDGEKRQTEFGGWLGLTLASVMMLVVSGNLLLLALAWICTSLGLRQLLLFYPERPVARRAARKHFVMSRIADAALLSAFGLLWVAFGTGDIGQILAAAGNTAASGAILAATIFLAAAAIFMSAQIPTHGWLTEVMEAPTPVSALLHAGVINAGGFLLIRFADVMLLAPGVLAVLAVVGGMTALFGSLTMLTQPAVKTSLAWSTIGQMGFMIMQCGLALFPLALLHIVAHSLYKAHAFLVSGSAVETVASIKRPGPIAIPNGWAVFRAFAIALMIYTAMVFGFGPETKSVQAIALGAILVFGIAYLIAQGLADAAPRELTIRTAFAAFIASASYFVLHAAAKWLTDGTLPPTPAAGPLECAVIVLTITSFGLVAVGQAMFPLWAYHPAAAGLRVHLANGLYANTLLDRWLGTWSTSRP